MIIKLPFIRVKDFFSFFSFFLFIFCTNDTYAQCSGIAGNDDNSLNICDITNVSSTAIDLNLQLGSHITGGTWKDDDRSGGLNRTTGILNAQLIKKSGVYKYTYTVSDALGCTSITVRCTVLHKRSPLRRAYKNHEVAGLRVSTTRARRSSQSRYFFYATPQFDERTPTSFSSRPRPTPVRSSRQRALRRC